MEVTKEVHFAVGFRRSTKARSFIWVWISERLNTSMWKQ